MENKLSIIIVNYNLAEEIYLLLKSIYKYENPQRFYIYVVDNNSPNRDIEILVNQYPEVRFVFLDTNYGFGHANNQILKTTNSEFMLLLNPDTLLYEDSISKVLKFMQINKQVGIAGVNLIKENGDKQNSAMFFPGYIEEFFNIFFLAPYINKFRQRYFLNINNDYYKTDFVSGSFFMIRQDVINQIGFFDEDYFLFTEETDYCYRLYKETDYNVVLLNTTSAYHYGGKISSKVIHNRILWENESKLKFFNKRYSLFKAFILRIFKILSFVVRISVITIKGNIFKQKDIFFTYFYLIKYYLKYW